MSPERLEKKYKLHRQLHKQLEDHASDILSSEKFQSTRTHIQHGSIPVHRHCIDVAKHALLISNALKMRVNEKEMIRGALLHDYFLYDWHDKGKRPEGLHGYRHPGAALKNASRDYELTDREKDIIRSHMWPLTLTKIPHYKEAWIVSAADKFCSLLETLKLRHGAANKYIENKKRQSNSAKTDG
ncbi:MAG: phosphohydrolase [Lachnospiraceae bacterium]|nr:phosphohydrolase [Lachnospiraceae bacterium]